MKLLSERALERSAVVANCRMNRERSLVGSNGYAKELGFQPLEFLKERCVIANAAAWLDLCCGSGKALIEAARLVHAEGMAAKIEIVGVDLVGMFAVRDPYEPSVRLLEASLSTWSAERLFDLITCVHGLHYVGDKLGLIKRAASWLTSNGSLVANLDPTNLKLADGSGAGRKIMADLRRLGLHYDAKRRLVICRGKKIVELPYRYMGADDQAGPNYTGQPAVNSYYEALGPAG
jgi:SAM-dependent methyltransferase